MRPGRRSSSFTSSLRTPLGIWALLAVLGTLLVVRIDAGSRSEQQRQFQLRTSMAAQFTESYLGNLQAQLLARAQQMLTAPQVSADQLSLAIAGLDFTAGGLFDDQGRLLVGLPYNADLVGRDFANLEQVRYALQQDRPAVSPVNISPALRTPVVAVGVPFGAGSGRRVVTGVFSVHGGALAAALRRALVMPGNAIHLVDSAGNMASSTDPLAAEITAFARVQPGLAAALSDRPSGRYAGDAGNRYFASAAVFPAGWRLVATVDTARLYAPVRRSSRVDNAMLAGSLALGLAVAWAMASAGHRRRLAEDELRTLNDRLEDKVRERTTELADSVSRLAAANAELESRRVDALEINDQVLQRIVVAQGELALGEPERAQAELGAALEAVRKVVSRLLPMRMTPGSLRQRFPLSR